MVAYHRPIPERKPHGKAGADEPPNGGVGGGMINAWVQAEKMMQIALMLPSAGFIGWLAGYGLDRWLHQTWIGMSGAIFGIIAGLVGAVRMAMVYNADPTSEKSNENGNEMGKSDKTGDSGKTS